MLEGASLPYAHLTRKTLAVLPITDPDDPRVADYRDIRERDLVRTRAFVAEGEVVVRTLLSPRSRFRARSILIAEQRLPAKADLVEAAGAVPVYAAAQAVMDRIVGFPIHRGILGIGAAEATPSAAALLATLPEEALVVVAIGIANHDNIGGIFRNAAAFGAAAVLCDAACCHPLYRKAIRVSVGTALTQPFAILPRDADPVALLADAGFEAMALSPAGTEDLRDVRPGPRTALLVGPEGPGLPEALLRRTRTVRIPMAPGVDSLNVAVTTGIVLHHLTAMR